MGCGPSRVAGDLVPAAHGAGADGLDDQVRAALRVVVAEHVAHPHPHHLSFTKILLQGPAIKVGGRLRHCARPSDINQNPLSEPFPPP